MNVKRDVDCVTSGYSEKCLSGSMTSLCYFISKQFLAFCTVKLNYNEHQINTILDKCVVILSTETFTTRAALILRTSLTDVPTMSI